MTKSDLLLKNISLIYVAFCLPKISVGENGDINLVYEWTNQEAKEVFNELNREYIRISIEEVTQEYIQGLRSSINQI